MPPSLLTEALLTPRSPMPYHEIGDTVYFARGDTRGDSQHGIDPDNDHQSDLTHVGSNYYYRGARIKRPRWLVGDILKQQVNPHHDIWLVVALRWRPTGPAADGADSGGKWKGEWKQKLRALTPPSAALAVFISREWFRVSKGRYSLHPLYALDQGFHRRAQQRVYAISSNVSQPRLRRHAVSNGVEQADGGKFYYKGVRIPGPQLRVGDIITYQGKVRMGDTVTYQQQAAEIYEVEWAVDKIWMDMSTMTFADIYDTSQNRMIGNWRHWAKCIKMEDANSISESREKAEIEAWQDQKVFVEAKKLSLVLDRLLLEDGLNGGSASQPEDATVD